MAWELSIALVCFLLAPPIAEVAGATLTIPVWGELLLCGTAAGTAGLTMRRRAGRGRAD